MKYLDEYRDSAQVRTLAAAIRRATTRPWNIMELCGGQTHSIARYRLDEMIGGGGGSDGNSGGNGGNTNSGNSGGNSNLQSKRRSSEGRAVSPRPPGPLRQPECHGALGERALPLIANSMASWNNTNSASGGGITMLHGPGCPVCVTPVATIDAALRLAREPNIILASFGDMLRVPGTDSDLLRAKAAGADVRMLYSTLDAVEIAAQNPSKEIVFFAVGFETTAPVHLMALKAARQRGLKNFSLLASLFTVPAAIDAILAQPDNRVDGFLAAGHVCAITGYEDYVPLAQKYRLPIVVTGFEPVDLLYGLHQCVLQLESGRAFAENAYKRVVAEKGNPGARALMSEMLEPCDQEWRGIGVLPRSGLRLRPAWRDCDAAKKFARLLTQAPARDVGASLATPSASASASVSAFAPAPVCIAGEIMKGNKHVSDCPHFGKTCTPETPIGAPMVSDEGVCSAYYTYRKN